MKYKKGANSPLSPFCSRDARGSNESVRTTLEESTREYLEIAMAT